MQTYFRCIIWLDLLISEEFEYCIQFLLLIYCSKCDYSEKSLALALDLEIFIHGTR